MRALLLAGLVIVPGTAWAGCANYTDGSLSAPAPRATICFDGKCEDTTMDYECGNATWVFAGYANGWRVDYTEEETVVSHRGERIDPARVTCADIDEFACRFPDAISFSPAPIPEPRPAD